MKTEHLDLSPVRSFLDGTQSEKIVSGGPHLLSVRDRPGLETNDPDDRV
jgi:hypothetical protein